MKKETYYKNKIQFTLNYMLVKSMYYPLNVPIDLCMKGIHGKQKFFTYYSYDCGARGNCNVASIDKLKRYYTWENKVMSKLAEPLNKNMFKYEDTFERFDKYINSRQNK